MNTLKALLLAMCFMVVQGGIAPVASAEQYNLELARVSLGNSRGASDAASLEGINFIYDDVAGTITQVSATTTVGFELSAAMTLFDHHFSGVVFDVAGTAISGTAFACEDGTFGSVVGADMCANTSWGENGVSETTWDYSTIPGTRNVGGDDGTSGMQQQLTDYIASLASFDGSTVIIDTPLWAASPGLAGMQLEFTVAAPTGYELQLVRVSLGNSRGASDAATLEGVDFIYDDVAGTITQISATTTVGFELSAAMTLFNHHFSGVVFDVAGTAISGTAFACEDGTFGSVVGADMCANTSWGENGISETTWDYSTIPGTRSVGGDDGTSGMQQQLVDYIASLASFDGSTVIIDTPLWAASPGLAGMQLEFVSTSLSPPVDVPEIRALDQVTAEADIIAADLTVGTVSMANHPSVPAGQVISQNPSACVTCIVSESAVNFVVSLGPIAGGTVLDQLSTLRDDVSALNLNYWLEGSLLGQIDRAAVGVKRGRYLRAKLDMEYFTSFLNWLSGGMIAKADADNLLPASYEILDRLEKAMQATPESGLQTFMSQGSERSYYIEVPEDYSATGVQKPVLFMFHGTGGTHTRFLPGGLYAVEGEDLRAKVGNDAILVYPNALPNENGVNQWDVNYDFDFVEDLIAELRGDLVIDEDRLFATGHSSGGGFSHGLGCRMGDVFRGVAPSAGALTVDTCTGSVAVMHIQSQNDTVVSPGITGPTKNAWVSYNGFDDGVFSDGTVDPCEDYSLGNSPYPVQWCMHDDTGRGGHQWWTKAGVIWDFFATLPIAKPTADHPPGGGNDRDDQGAGSTLSFTVEYPSNIGEVHSLAAVLYPAGTQQPLTVGPVWFLNLNVDFGTVTPGTQQSYQTDIQLFDSSAEMPLPGTYTISIVAYVVGGGYPTPIAGIDHIVLLDVEIVDKTSPIVIEGVLILEPVL